MDRRRALKNLGTGIGAFTFSTSMINLLQSCQNQTSLNLLTFSNKQFSFVSKLMDLIIPGTDLPGATDLKLNIFIDSYISEVWYSQNKDIFIKGLDKCLLEVENYDDKNLIAVLDKYLKIDKKISDKYDDMISDYEDKIKLGQNPSFDQNIFQYVFIKKLRDLSVMSFKINEYIAENVLAYTPIPGDYKGCVDLEETTGGKAWSL